MMGSRDNNRLVLAGRHHRNSGAIRSGCGGASLIIQVFRSPYSRRFVRLRRYLHLEPIVSGGYTADFCTSCGSRRTKRQRCAAPKRSHYNVVGCRPLGSQTSHETDAGLNSELCLDSLSSSLTSYFADEHPARRNVLL
jgi:hypothetical protein